MVEQIGNCRVVAEIGSGGMAVVYKAVQESLQRTVAIKALKPSMAEDESFAIRFEREALSVAALQHENIIQVYDFHRASGTAYIVMEFVEGIDLYDLLEKAPVLPPDVSAIIAMQVARALDYAHFRGIIHRDIKPANIMVAKSGGVKLMDFGIARDQSFGDLTRDGTGLGTPSYMSPEQIVGDKLDSRSDVFALGVVLYQMVCGRKPFIEDEHRSVMQKIRTEKPMAPQRLNPKLPKELEKILLRCLEKRREDRFRSTQDLVVALELYVSRRCEMNYRARLVVFLRELGLISHEEANRALHPAVAGGYAPEARVGGARGSLRRLVAVEGTLLGTMALAASLIHLSPIGSSAAADASSARAGQKSERVDKPSGFVKLSVDPWADVYVDGKLIDTTPLAQPLSIPEGHHRIELKNPNLKSEARDIQVKRGTTQTLKVALRK